MKVCVFGCARSGTTAVYTLIQEIMIDNSGKNVEFVYEPFLWEKEYFNDRFDNVSGNFNFLNSISIEGIFNHARLPILIDDPKPFKDNEYLKKFFHPKGTKQKNILLKFIRASGRYLLLNDIAPRTKFIFIIRNPADTVNSIINNFSFFGGEFHRDDFSRFLLEVNQTFKTDYSKEDFKTQTERELFYWLYMNGFALESFKKVSSKPLILNHEEILKDRKEFVNRICTYLKVAVKPKYNELNKKEVGSITREFKVSGTEMEMYDYYLGKYTQMLEEHRIPYSFSKEKILEKYKNVKEPILPANEKYGLNPLVITKKWEQDKSKNKNIILQKDQQIEEKKKEVKYKEVQIREKDEQLREKDELITQKDTLIEKKDLEGKQKDEQIREKDEQLGEKKALLAYKDTLIREKEIEVRQKDDQIREKDEQLRVKDDLVSKKDSLIEEKTIEMKQNEKQFREKERLMKNKIEAVLQKEHSYSVSNRLIVNKYEERLRRIYNSYSYRLGTGIIKSIKFLIGWLPYIKRKMEKRNFDG